MMNKKTLYTTPSTEALVIRFEENIMSPGTPGGNLGDGGSYDFGDDD